MADKKIADLIEATTISDTDIVVVQDNENTKKMTWANLKTAIIGAFSSILGNRTYTEQNVVTNGESITDSIDALDTTVATHLADNVTQGNPHGIDAKANKTQMGWLTPTLLNGWSGPSARYRKNEFGMLEFKGSVNGGATAVGTPVLSVDAGFTPTITKYFFTSTYDSSLTVLQNIGIDLDGRLFIATNPARRFILLDSLLISLN